MRSLRLLAVALLVLAVTACGASGDEENEAQPERGGGFVQGEFDDIPRHPGSDQIQAATETDEVVTASYVVETAQPRTVLRFYDQTLPNEGWTTTEAPVEAGRDVWRGTWRRDGDRLEVSASPAEGLEDGNFANPTQYSLVLHSG
jgi:hypothetical protein